MSTKSTKRKSTPPSAGSPPKKPKTGGSQGPPQFVKAFAPGAAAASSNSGSSGSSGRSANETPNYDFGVTGPQQWLPNPETGKKAWTTVGSAFTVQHKETGDMVPVTAEVVGDAIKAENNESTGTKVISFPKDGQTLKQVVPENPVFFTNVLFRLKDAYKNGQSGKKLSGEFVKRNPAHNPQDEGSEKYVRDEEANDNAEKMLFSFPELIYKYWQASRTNDKPWYDDKKNKNKLHPTLAREWQVLVKDYESAWEAMFDDGWEKTLAETSFKDFVWHRVNLVPKTMDVDGDRYFATQSEGGKLECLLDADGNSVPYDQEQVFDEFPPNVEFHKTTKLVKQRFSPKKNVYIFTESTHYWEGNAYTDSIPSDEPGRMYFVGQAKAVVDGERNVLALSVDDLTDKQRGEGGENFVLHKNDVVQIKKLRGAIGGIMKKAGAKVSPALKTYRAGELKVVYRSSTNSYPLDCRSWDEQKSAVPAGTGAGGGSYGGYDQFAADDEKWA